MPLSVPIPIGWDALCLLIALVSFFIAVLVHMLGTSFGMPNLTMFAKSEYAQVLVTVLIILFAVGMRDAGGAVIGQVTAAVAKASGNIVLADAVDHPTVPEYASHPIEIAKAYLPNGPISCAKSIYWATFYNNLWREALSSITFGVGNVEGVGGGFFLGGYVSLAHYIAHNLTYVVLMNYVQYFLMMFAQYTMLQIFLPIGLVLRAFPATRGAGGLVTAFALGLAFVYPTTYLLIVAMAPSTEHACTQVRVMAQQAEASPIGSPCFNNAGALMAAVYDLNSNTERDQAIDTSLIPFKQLYAEAAFYPMISLIITFSFIRQTASLFGSDLAEIGRGFIKII